MNQLSWCKQEDPTLQAMAVQTRERERGRGSPVPVSRAAQMLAVASETGGHAEVTERKTYWEEGSWAAQGISTKSGEGIQ